MIRIALVLLIPLRLFACECRILPICERLEYSPVVFIGEVIEGGLASLADDPWRSDVKHAKFKVLEVFRGLAAGTRTVDIHLHSLKGMCAPVPYSRGKRYLVTPRERDGVLS